MEPITIVCTIATIGMLFGIPPARRLAQKETELNFNYLVAIPGFAGLMYVLMAFGIGSVTFQGYQVPLPRYVDWILTTPLLVGYTAYIAGMGRRDTLAIVLADILMIGLGVVAIVLEPPGQWVAFGLSSVCHLSLLVALYGPIRRSAWKQDATRRRLGRLLLNYIGLLWLTYPVVWLFGPGLQMVTPTGIAVIIAYIDVVGKVPFVYFIYRASQNSAPAENAQGETTSSLRASVSTSSAR
jgi:sensory rhodopsin